MNYKDKRILVTGGAGFIGSEVVSQLLKKNAMVTVLDNFSSGKRQYLKKDKKNLKIIKGDITDEKIVSKSVKDQEYVIHLAALPFIPDSFYSNLILFFTQLMVDFNPSSNEVNALKPSAFAALSFLRTLLDCPIGFDSSNTISGL